MLINVLQQRDSLSLQLDSIRNELAHEQKIRTNYER